MGQKKINIKGNAEWNCPICGSKDITFDGSDGGFTTDTKDCKAENLGNLLSYSCKCKDCGAILQSTYLFLGNLTIAQYNSLAKSQVDESIYDTNLK